MPEWLKFGVKHECPTFSGDTTLGSVRFAVVDTELTSLDDRSNRLLSVGAIVMTGTKIHVGEQFYRVANPGVAVPAPGVVIHKLRPLDVEGGESPERVIGELRSFLDGTVLVGHFAEIDRNVLRKEFAQAGYELKNPMVCTARVQRWIVKKRPYKEDQFHELEHLDLATLAKVYQLEHRDAHHALDDAFLTAQLWQKQMYALERLGVGTLGNLLRIAKV